MNDRQHKNSVGSKDQFPVSNFFFLVSAAKLISEWQIKKVTTTSRDLRSLM